MWQYKNWVHAEQLSSCSKTHTDACVELIIEDRFWLKISIKPVSLWVLTFGVLSFLFCGLCVLLFYETTLWTYCVIYNKNYFQNQPYALITWRNGCKSKLGLQFWGARAVNTLWMGHDWPLPGVQLVAGLPAGKLRNSINVSIKIPTVLLFQLKELLSQIQCCLWRNFTGGSLV